MAANENPDYNTDCHSIPLNTIYIKFEASVIDYFRPVQGSTYCEMLQSHTKHQWSSDGKTWVTPSYYSAHLGGSSHGYPADGRSYLSFWGGNGNQGGYDSGWNKAFKLYYGTAGINVYLAYHSKI